MKKLSATEQILYMKKLADYLQIYGWGYSDNNIDLLLSTFLAPIPTKDLPDILKQIYAAFDMLEPEENCYLQFAKMVGERYGWDAHILEIGGGVFPAFAKYVDELQQEHGGKGTITTYDPWLVVDKLGNVKLHREAFSYSMPVDSFDLIVGIMPCKATEAIIRKATLSHKEFFLAMCGCIHYELIRDPSGCMMMSRLTYENYKREVYALAKKQEADGFEVREEYAKQYSFKYPIISSRVVK